MKLSEAVSIYIKMRDKKAQMKAEFDASVAPLNEKMEKLEAKLLDVFNKTGIDSVKTEFGTAYTTTRVTASVADREIFMTHVRENDDWDEDGVELRPLVDSARSDGDSAGSSTARQRNAALSYCCLMFMCCLGAQLATRVDPDAIRNSIPFITHSCDGKGCERTVMIQVSTPFVCSPSTPFFVLHAF